MLPVQLCFKSYGQLILSAFFVFLPNFRFIFLCPKIIITITVAIHYALHMGSHMDASIWEEDLSARASQLFINTL